MLEEYTVAQIKSLLDSAESVLIICGNPDDVQCLTAAAAWQLTLQTQGSDSRLILTHPVSGEVGLPGTDQALTELGNENLTISFDYSEEQVDKVSYHIGDDTQKFYLTIKPKAGAQPLDSSSVEFSYTGASADLLIIIGADQPEQLGQLYTGYEDLFANTASIVIAPNPQFGSLKLEQGTDGELETMTAGIFQQLGYQLPADAATNLLYLIDERTQGLQQAATPETFDQVAELLRAGGERVWQAARQPRLNGNTAQTGHTSTKKASNQKKSTKREITVERKSNNSNRSSSTAKARQ